ncbi:PilZ domain-containing protein [Falsibacillus albus]|uniref:PilZ domain-containing protein n=1 Tax=Falsibacillus albus TaxID=2478915 RepID=A0A3L7K493_9BACI|nr:PilZ domain-containing protein [Falsibacillus albus]RLQ97089.1 PilZ domain-containing protein [Falsibacillus albus]
MQFKRKEPFRYSFTSPIQGSFRLFIEKDKELIETKEGNMEIIDLSPKGIKFRSKLNIPVERTDLHLHITFVINEKAIEFVGKLKWKRQSATDFIYGVSSFGDDNLAEDIVRELKSFSKKKIDES